MFTRAIPLHTLAEEIRRIEGGFGSAHLRRHISTGIEALDAQLPGCGLAAAAIHELYSTHEGGGLWTTATWLVRQSTTNNGFIFWFDERKDFYPNAAEKHGIELNRFVLIQPKTRQESLWGMDQALRCRSVAAVIGSVPRLSRAEVRRLQLAAEVGGGVGILLSHKAADIAAGGAASRWKISPATSVGNAQRFWVEVEKCRGGNPLPPVLLEVTREKILVAVSPAMANRTDTTKVARSATA